MLSSFLLGTAGIMESQDYTLWNFNVSALFQGVCDSLVFTLVVLSSGYLLGLPVSVTDMLYVSTFLAFSYAYIRVLEASMPLLRKVRES